MRLYIIFCLILLSACARAQTTVKIDDQSGHKEVLRVAPLTDTNLNYFLDATNGLPIAVYSAVNDTTGLDSGDILYAAARGNYLTRLAATTNGYVLTLSGGLPVWAPATAGTGAVDTVKNTDGTLTISPVVGTVIASVNQSHWFSWTGTNTFTPPSDTSYAIIVNKHSVSQSQALQVWRGTKDSALIDANAQIQTSGGLRLIGDSSGIILNNNFGDSGQFLMSKGTDTTPVWATITVQHADTATYADTALSLLHWNEYIWNWDSWGAPQSASFDIADNTKSPLGQIINSKTGVNSTGLLVSTDGANADTNIGISAIAELSDTVNIGEMISTTGAHQNYGIQFADTGYLASLNYDILGTNSKWYATSLGTLAATNEYQILSNGYIGTLDIALGTLSNGRAWAFPDTSGTVALVPSGGGLIVQGTGGIKITNSGKTTTISDTATGGGGMTNPMTTTGDMIYSSDNLGTPARLGIGSTNNVLTVSGGLPSWQAPASLFTLPQTIDFDNLICTDSTGMLLVNHTAANGTARSQKSPQLTFQSVYQPLTVQDTNYWSMYSGSGILGTSTSATFCGGSSGGGLFPYFFISSKQSGSSNWGPTPVFALNPYGSIVLNTTNAFDPPQILAYHAALTVGTITSGGSNQGSNTVTIYPGGPTGSGGGSITYVDGGYKGSSGSSQATERHLETISATGTDGTTGALASITVGASVLHGSAQIIWVPDTVEANNTTGGITIPGASEVKITHGTETGAFKITMPTGTEGQLLTISNTTSYSAGFATGTGVIVAGETKHYEYLNGAWQDLNALTMRPQSFVSQDIDLTSVIGTTWNFLTPAGGTLAFPSAGFTYFIPTDIIIVCISVTGPPTGQGLEVGDGTVPGGVLATATIPTTATQEIIQAIPARSAGGSIYGAGVTPLITSTGQAVGGTLHVRVFMTGIYY